VVLQAAEWWKKSIRNWKINFLESFIYNYVMLQAAYYCFREVMHNIHVLCALQIPLLWTGFIHKNIYHQNVNWKKRGWADVVGFFHWPKHKDNVCPVWRKHRQHINNRSCPTIYSFHRSCPTIYSFQRSSAQNLGVPR